MYNNTILYESQSRLLYAYIIQYIIIIYNATWAGLSSSYPYTPAPMRFPSSPTGVFGFHDVRWRWNNSKYSCKTIVGGGSVGFMGTSRLYSAHHVCYYIEYDAIVCYRETREKRVCLFKRVFIAYRFSSPGLSRTQSISSDPHRYGLIIILFDNIYVLSKSYNVSILSSCNKLHVYNAHIYYVRMRHTNGGDKTCISFNVFLSKTRPPKTIILYYL